ncbi:MAG: porin [Gammaproteobacteria bacterium]|nr:porin [Gammaproteobacteria bacterium]
MKNKKMIALTFSAAMVAPVFVQAETTTYAHIQFEIANFKDPNRSITVMKDNGRGRVGMKGSHDLEDGMKAFAVAEFDLVGGNQNSEYGDGVDSAGDSFRGNALRIREVSASLQTKFGTIETGTLKSAYKYAGGTEYDPFLNTTLEGRGNYAMSGGVMGHNSFINNAIAYKNQFGPIRLWLTYSPDENDTDNDTKRDDGQNTSSLKYNAQSFEVFVSRVDRATTLNDYTSNKIGGKVNIGESMALMGQYEMIDVSGTDRTNIFLGYQLHYGKSQFVLQYGEQVTEDSVKNDLDGEYGALGAIYHFNKSVSSFAGYREIKGKGNNENKIISFGLRVDI